MMTPDEQRQEDFQKLKEILISSRLSERHALCMRLAAIDRELSALGKPIKEKEKQKA